MAVTIDSLELKITNDSKDAVKGINSLVRALRRLKEVAGMGADLVEVAKAIRAIKKATDSKGVASGVAKGMKEVQKATKGATEAMDAHVKAWEHEMKIREALADMKIIDTPDDTPLDNYDEDWVRFKAFEGNTNSVDYGNQVTEFVNAYKTEAELAQQAKLEKQEQVRLEKELTEEKNRQYRVEKAIVDQYEKEQRDAAKAEEKEKVARYKEAARAFKEAEKEKTRVAREEARARAREEKAAMKVVHDMTKGFSRLGNMISRTIMRRAILGALRAITDGFKTGIENLYHYSDAMGSLDSANTKNSLDAISTALLYMKNSIGAAVAPLIQSLVPVLQTVVGWAVQAANAINMFISSLQGKGTYTKAKESATTMFESVESSAGGANKAAKELRATLLGFDEINRLDAPNSGGGGGGGGSSKTTPNYGDMFEEATIDLAYLDKVKKIFRDILEYAILIGAAIAGWKIGMTIGNVLGLGLGKTLALALGVALAVSGAVAEIMGLVSILKEGIDWVNTLMTILGGIAFIIGATIVGAVFDMALAFGMVASVIAGIPMIVVGIISAIKEGLNELNGVLIVVGAVLTGFGAGGLIGAAIGLYLGLITDGIIWLTQNIDDLKEAFGSSAGLGAVLGGVFSGLILPPLAPIGAAIGAIIGLIVDLQDTSSETYAWFSGAITDIQTAFSDAWAWINENVFVPIGEAAVAVGQWFMDTAETVRAWVVEKFEIVRDFLGEVWETVKTKTEEVWNAILEYFDPIISWFELVFSDVKDGILTVWNDAKTGAEESWGAICEFVEGVLTDIKDGAIWVYETIEQGLAPFFTWLSDTIDEIGKTASDIWDNIKTIATGVIDIIKEAARIAWEWTQTNIIDPMAEFFAGLWEGIQLGAEILWDTFVTMISDSWEETKRIVSEAWDDIVADWEEGWSLIEGYCTDALNWLKTNLIDPLGEKLTKIWTDFKDKAQEAYDGLKGIFSGFAEWIGGVFSDGWEKVKKVFSTGGMIFKDITTSISSAFKKIVNSLISGINKVVSKPFNAINSALTTLKNADVLGFKPFSNLKTISVPSIPYMAKGGYPQGDLFIANDAGAELVGTVNGRTAVASNQEITGITDAVNGASATESALLREQNNLLRQLLAQSGNVTITADSIVSGLARKNRRDGVSTVPVSI